MPLGRATYVKCSETRVVGSQNGEEGRRDGLLMEAGVLSRLIEGLTKHCDIMAHMV